MHSGYNEFRYWSPFHDAEVSRVSLWNHRGDEYFMIVTPAHGKQYRAARDTAIEAIVTAIEMSLDPGEVRIN